MTANRRVLLLIGSPKGKSSASYTLGSYMLEHLAGHGLIAETLRVRPSLDKPQWQAELLAAVERCDLLLHAAPLYVDTAPAPVIRAMELIHRRRRAHPEAGPKQLAVIVNCGFPEAWQNENALAVYQRFARESGIGWLGGLALGMGGMIGGGKALGSMGRLFAPVRRALELAALALSAGQPMPQEAVDLMARPLIPRWLYILLVSVNWRLWARRFGVWRLNRRPFREPA
ncbi:MAG: hypothetical protein ACOY94_24515 [Bacillota bacterium]